MTSGEAQCKNVHVVEDCWGRQMREAEKGGETSKIEDLWKVETDLMVHLITNCYAAVEKQKSTKEDHHKSIRPERAYHRFQIAEDLSAELRDQPQGLVGMPTKLGEHCWLKYSNCSHASSEHYPNNISLSEKEGVDSHNGRTQVLVVEAEVIH